MKHLETRVRRFSVSHTRLVGVAVLLSAATVYGQASFQSLGDLPGGNFNSAAEDISATGEIVVGASSSTFGNSEAYRWTSDGGMIGLGALSSSSFNSLAKAISADGSVVVGFSNSLLGTEAFHWTADGGMIGWGT